MQSIGDQQEALGVGAAANYEVHEDDLEVQIKERKISFSSKDGQELNCKLKILFFAQFLLVPPFFPTLSPTIQFPSETYLKLNIHLQQTGRAHLTG